MGRRTMSAHALTSFLAPGGSSVNAESADRKEAERERMDNRKKTERFLKDNGDIPPAPALGGRRAPTGWSPALKNSPGTAPMARVSAYSAMREGPCGGVTCAAGRKGP